MNTFALLSIYLFQHFHISAYISSHMIIRTHIYAINMHINSLSHRLGSYINFAAKQPPPPQAAVLLLLPTLQASDMF